MITFSYVLLKILKGSFCLNDVFLKISLKNFSDIMLIASFSLFYTNTISNNLSQIHFIELYESGPNLAMCIAYSFIL